jgi:hypothetical protein
MNGQEEPLRIRRRISARAQFLICAPIKAKATFPAAVGRSPSDRRPQRRQGSALSNKYWTLYVRVILD